MLGPGIRGVSRASYVAQQRRTPTQAESEPSEPGTASEVKLKEPPCSRSVRSCGGCLAWWGGRSGVVLRAELVNGVDERAEVLRIDVGRYAMAEVEYVPRPATVAREHIGHALPDRLR